MHTWKDVTYAYDLDCLLYMTVCEFVNYWVTEDIVGEGQADVSKEFLKTSPIYSYLS